MKSIFSYEHYKDYVNHWIEEQPKKGHGLLSHIARELGIHTTLLSHTLRGDKDLTAEQAVLIAEFMNFSVHESDYFLCLVLRDRAGNAKLKLKYERELKRLKSESTELAKRVVSHVELSQHEKAQFYSSWIYAGLRQLSCLERYKTMADLSRAFDIRKEDFNEVIAFLLETGLCKERDGKIEIGPSNTHLESKSPYVFQHHRNWRIKGFEKHGNLSKEELMYTAPFTISNKDFEFLREEVVKLIQTLIRTADNTKSERLACLNVDLFLVK